MNPRRVLAACFLLAGCARESTSVPGALRVMPLGDSITQGSISHPSYRRPLWHMVQKAGWNVDFVGSQRRTHWGGPLTADFDPDHEGHWGWTIDQILDELEGWVRLSRPDAVLVHLGSNDLFGGEAPQEVAEGLGEVIARLRAVNPRIAIFLAELIPARDMEGLFAEANEHIRRLAERSTADSPVVVVDMFNGFDPRRHTYDGVHPNAEGEQFMAERGFAALRPWIERRPAGAAEGL